MNRPKHFRLSPLLSWMKISLMLLLCGLPLAAQQRVGVAALQQIELPPGNLLGNAPNFAKWTITFTYPEDLAAPKPPDPAMAYLRARPRTITTTKTGEIVCETIVDLAGMQTEKWYVGATQYSLDRDSSQWLQRIPESSPGAAQSSDYTPLPACGFRDFGWLTRESFTGALTVDNKETWLFSSPKEATIPADPLLPPAKSLAYIDSTTRLPIALYIHGELRRFQFLPPPTEKLPLPRDLVTQIKQGEEGRARLLQPAARPY